MTIGALRAASLKPLVIHVRYRQLLNSVNNDNDNKSTPNIAGLPDVERAH